MACGFFDQVFCGVLTRRWGGDVLGVVFGAGTAGEEVGCCFWSATLCGLGEQLEVLGFEDGAEGGEVIVREGVEGVGHCSGRKRLQMQNGGLKHVHLRNIIFVERADDESTRSEEALWACTACATRECQAEYQHCPSRVFHERTTRPSSFVQFWSWRGNFTVHIR